MWILKPGPNSKLLMTLAIFCVGIIISVVITIELSGCFIRPTTPDFPLPLPPSCQQLVVVVTPTWESCKGTLYRFDYSARFAGWYQNGQSCPIILGRHGMGWGRGLHQISSDTEPIKTEGDGRSPAGVFQLGSAFGFPPANNMRHLRLPYIRITNQLECVDDPESRYYTRLLERNQVDSIDWQSAENLSQASRAYYLGVVIEHNTVMTQKNAGSCVFLHCWTAPDDATPGCTTLERKDMEILVNWLNAAAEPVLVQLPLSVYRTYQKAWKLPDLPVN